MNLSSTTLSTSTPNRTSADVANNGTQHNSSDAGVMTSSGTPPTPGFKFPGKFL